MIGADDSLGREAEAAFVPARATLAGLLDWLADRVVLFRLGNLIFVTYGLFAAVGAFVSLALLAALLLGQGLAATEVLLLMATGAVGILVFSRLAALALDWRALVRDPVRTLRSVGFSSWGGLLAIALTLMLFSALTGHKMLRLMDAMALAGPLGHAIGRLGCISYGCCFGRPARGGLTVRYTNPDAKAVRVADLSGVPLHPAPLYEALWDAAVFLILNLLALQGVPDGVPATMYLLLYGMGRLATEFLRDNTSRFLWRGLAVNHALALGFSGCGLIFLPVVLVVRAPGSAVSIGDGAWPGLAVLSTAFLLSLIVFVAFSVHRNRVGEW